MNSIKIIRLQNGTDLIAEIKELDDDFVNIREPLEIFSEMDQNNIKSIYFTPWLPVSMIYENVTKIKMSNILFIIEPTEMTIEHYGKAILNMTLDKTESLFINDDTEEDYGYDSSFDLEDSDEDEELDELIETQEALSKVKNITYH